MVLARDDVTLVRVTFRRASLGSLAAVLAAACAQGAADTTTFGTQPGDPRPSAPAIAPADGEAGAEDGGAGEPGDDAAPPADAAPSDAGNVTDAAADAASPFDAGPPPTIDGTIAPGEYGVHVDGQNRQASPGAAPTTTWYMTWSETHLYLAVSAANVAEGLVLYVDHAPGAAAGSTAGNAYDGTNIASLPIPADFVAYVKSSYQEHRVADGANGWSAPVTAGITVAGTGNVREIAIPWTAIRPAGRPSSFAWLGYVTSPGGYVYGPMPTTNAGGNIGTAATYAAFYRVTDATPGTGTRPFSLVGP